MSKQPSVIWNLPNRITLARLALTVAAFVAVAAHRYGAALVLFLLAAASDWLDGYLARRFQAVTKLGRILDPLADKLLICGMFIFLAAIPRSGIVAWMAVVVVARELLVTVLRSFLEAEGVDFSARMAGKLKMVLQSAAVVVSLLVLSRDPQSADGFGWLSRLLPPLVWLAVLSTIYSGLGYAVRAWRLLFA
jgi:CDP-diacylglycerol--glycerol-3-phosphate 3-phosphatidyltransferase